MADQSVPTVRRPHMPAEYGMPQDQKGLLPWAWAEEQLSKASNYWICTVDAAGKPHAVPVWAAWLNGLLYFDGHPRTRWVRNLFQNPNIAVHLESGDEVVMVEGVAVDIPQATPELAADLLTAFAKYNNPYDPNEWIKRGLLYMKPQRVIAWRKFPEDMTRWDFSQ